MSLSEAEIFAAARDITGNKVSRAVGELGVPDEALRAARIDDDVDSADLSGVSGTPTFFVNGNRHYGAYDVETLSDAVRAAGARAVLTR